MDTTDRGYFIEEDKDVVFTNVNIVTTNEVVSGMRLHTKKGIIVALETEKEENKPSSTESVKVIDGKGLFLAPGFVDQHCHGGSTGRFMVDPEGAAAYHLRHGTTAVMATFSPRPTVEESLQSLKNFAMFCRSDSPMAEVIAGIHMEGPFTNPKYGAHRPWSIQPGPENGLRFFEAIKEMRSIWSVAPELPGCLEMCSALRLHAHSHLPRFLVGHTEANYEQITALLPYGLVGVTHCTNATGFAENFRPGIRSFGVDETCWLLDEISAEVIPDYYGVHVHPNMLRLILKIKGDKGVVIITDCTYRLDEVPEALLEKYELENLDVCFNAKGQLAGSKMTMDRACANMRRHTGASLVSVFRMASLNPARLIGIDDGTGSIEVGKRADLVLVDSNINLYGVWSKGREVNRQRE
ncbi:MAG: amidohydrolase family protein [Tissierellia bacterium]|nr:amidohydrolase family protein [Tissierellia bacterium]